MVAVLSPRLEAVEHENVALVCGVLGLVGVVAFWLSAPIVLGGLAVTLGVEGRRRADQGRGTVALAAIVIGAVAFVVGAAIWLLWASPD
jgi:hypothetical protein